ncbi:uncharacterized protein IL334_006735 [Kwoniella shivajii]|uniref:Uncharacterized protein n=1 Tax=Kwoniella shivajii TaxID=564305 RepID=A0ABZ1D6S3_9TREE|nr:hypothetical protein IL334_006735 [Kwoniella shivajii]
MEDDFEDLLRDTEDVEFESPEKPSTAKLPQIILNIDERSIPSANELRLGKKVFDLEKERDDLLAEISSLKKVVSLSSHPTIPIPISDPTTTKTITATTTTTSIANPFSTSSPAVSKTNTNSNEPIEIPQALIPILSLLRNHIEKLTRDNQSLRYTFLGPNPPSKGSIKTTQTPQISTPLPIPVPSNVPTPSIGVGSTNPSSNSAASSSKFTLDIDMASKIQSPGLMSAPTAQMSGAGSTGQTNQSSGPIPANTVNDEKGLPIQLQQQQVDLEKVLDRVKELIKENEELGEMVLEAGKRDEENWEQTLEESRNVITSLDSDLSHHLNVVQSLRKELSTYKSHFGSIPTPSSSASLSASASSTTLSINPPSKHPHAASSTSSTPTRHSGPRDDRHRNDRSRHDRDRDRESDRQSDGGRRFDNPSAGPRHGSGRRDERPPASNGTTRQQGSASGSGERGGKGDDRAYKRRR